MKDQRRTSTCRTLPGFSKDGFKPRYDKSRAGSRRCRPPSLRVTFPASSRPLQALPGSCHQTSPPLWHNGLGLLTQLVREPERGSRARARCCLGVWASVYSMRSRVGMRTTFPTTPLCESGPLAKCPLQRVLRGRSEVVGHRRLTSDGGTRRKRPECKAAEALTHPT